jgi:hypothetical protein
MGLGPVQDEAPSHAQIQIQLTGRERRRRLYGHEKNGKIFTRLSLTGCRELTGASALDQSSVT